MALIRARKVLEFVIRDIFERRVGESAGTRPLENLVQRLVKDGHLPARLEAYTETIRRLGNVGAHSFGESVTVADVYQSLAKLLPILEWYVEIERPESDALCTPSSGLTEDSARSPRPTVARQAALWYPRHRTAVRATVAAGVTLGCLAIVLAILWQRKPSRSSPVALRTAGPIKRIENNRQTAGKKANDVAPPDQRANERDKVSEFAKVQPKVEVPSEPPKKLPGSPTHKDRSVRRPVTSRFDDDNNEGWYTLNQDDTRQATSSLAVDTELFPQGRNWWLRADDLPNGKEFGWHAPTKYHGDHSDKYGRVLRYSIFTTGSGAPRTDWYVRLRGRGKTLFVDGTTLEPPKPQEWKRYSIRLDPSGGWKIFSRSRGIRRATEQDLKDVLSDVTDLRLKGEFGVGPNLGCLDNVVFGGDP